MEDNSVPVSLNSQLKPKTLRQAICMYIEYLIDLNERRVRVAEFNTTPFMDPNFDNEEYYHEVRRRFFMHRLDKPACMAYV